MKKFTISLVIFLLVVVSGLFAQQTQQIIELPGVKKDVIFTRSLNWIASEFLSAKAVIELQDKDQGKIIGNVLIKYANSFMSTVNMFTKLTIEVQNDKARITLLPIHIDYGTGTRSYQDRDLPRVGKEYSRIIENYKNFVSKEEEKW